MAMESTTLVTRPRAAVAPEPPIIARQNRAEQPTPAPSDISVIDANRAAAEKSAEQRSQAEEADRITAERQAVRESNVGSIINTLV